MSNFLEFYGLRQQPFGVTPDPAYLYRSGTHEEALSSLSSGIRDGRGFFALVAQPGMGKTTLLYQLIEELRDAARIAYLFQTQCDIREFLQYLLAELHVDARGMGLVALHNKLNEALFAEMLEGKRFVLIVDEAQNLDDQVLETVRLLSNFETTHTKLLQIVLAGQPELSAKLEHPKLLQLRQRIAVMTHLEKLSVEETAGYIDHRLRVAGCQRSEPLFPPEAVEAIAGASQGIPRNINNLCYHALSLASRRQSRTVTGAIARETAAKLGFTLALAVEPAAWQSAPPELEIKTFATRDVEPVIASPVDRMVQSLTYKSRSTFKQSRWALAAVSLMVLVVFAASARTIWRLASPSLTRAAAMPRAAAPRGTSQNYAAEFGSASFAATPQQSSSGQVLTVVALPGQTLKDISMAYAGGYNSAIVTQIRRLNPLLDPDHLQAGELIRIPLAEGTWKKAFDSEDSPRSPAQDPGPANR